MKPPSDPPGVRTVAFVQEIQRILCAAWSSLQSLISRHPTISKIICVHSLFRCIGKIKAPISVQCNSLKGTQGASRVFDESFVVTQHRLGLLRGPLKKDFGAFQGSTGYWEPSVRPAPKAGREGRSGGKLELRLRRGPRRDIAGSPTHPDMSGSRRDRPRREGYVMANSPHPKILQRFMQVQKN